MSGGGLSRLNSFMMHSVVFRLEAIWFISSSIILHTPSTQTLRFLSNNFLSSCKCVLCLFDFVCVTACVLAVLLLHVSIHPYQCVTNVRVRFLTSRQPARSLFEELGTHSESLGELASTLLSEHIS